jgi:hypothetical protein
VNFCAAYNDAIGSTLNNSKIRVGIWLCRGAEASITFDIGLRNRHRKIVTSAVIKECRDSLGSLCVAARGIKCSSNASESKKGVGSDLLDEWDQRVAARGSGFDEPRPIGKVGSRAGFEEIAAEWVGAFDNGQTPNRWILGEFEVD